MVRPITCVMLNVKVSLNLLANSIPAYPTPGLSADCGGHDFAKGRTMKRAYSKSQYAKPYERYCRELYPAEAEQIFQRAEEYYLEFMKDMPDLGENMMVKNMLDWLTIIFFYEASGHRLDGKALLEIKRRAVEKMKFIEKLVDGNRSKWPYRLFEKTYINFNRMQAEHQAKGEWLDSWKVEINPRPPHRWLQLSSRRLPDRKARQGARLRRAAALPLQDRPLPCQGHARAAHPHADRSPRRRLL